MGWDTFWPAVALFICYFVGIFGGMLVLLFIFYFLKEWLHPSTGAATRSSTPDDDIVLDDVLTGEIGRSATELAAHQKARKGQRNG